MDGKQQSVGGGEERKSFIGYLLHTNIQIWVLYLIFVGLSLYATMSASGSVVYDYMFGKGGGISPITKQWGIILVSIFVVVMMPLCCKAKYLRVAWGVYSLFSLFLLMMIVANPNEINQATRWTNMFGVSVQPSEFWKIWMVGLISYYSCRYVEKSGDKTWKSYLKYYALPLGILLPVIAFIGYSNVSTGLIYCIVTALLFWVCKMPIDWYVKTFASLALVVGLGIGVVMLLPQNMLPGRLATAKARVERILEAKEEEKFTIADENLQEQYARIALANSKLIGRGFGNSTIKDLLPMANSDYIFAVLIEELGILGLVGVPMLYIGWFWIASTMARRERIPFNRYMLYGIGIFFPLQALVNFAVVSGLFTTGQPLPFISAGGSSFLANSIAIGVMLIISRGQYDYSVAKEKEALAKEAELTALS